MRLEFRRLADDARLPAYARAGDAGLDLTSAADVTVEPGTRTMVPTGLAVAIPEGHAGLVLPRSGLASVGASRAPVNVCVSSRATPTCSPISWPRARG